MRGTGPGVHRLQTTSFDLEVILRPDPVPSDAAGVLMTEAVAELHATLLLAEETGLLVPEPHRVRVRRERRLPPINPADPTTATEPPARPPLDALEAAILALAPLLATRRPGQLSWRTAVADLRREIHQLTRGE